MFGGGTFPGAAETREFWRTLGCTRPSPYRTHRTTHCRPRWAGLSRGRSRLQDPDASHEETETGKCRAGSDTRIHQTIQQVKAQVAKRLGGGGGSDGSGSAFAHEVTHPGIYGILETSGERFAETT